MNTGHTEHGRMPETDRDSTARAAFVTTQWTAVLRAGRGDTTCAGAALEQLCRNYWPPLYAYVRRLGYSASDAQDLTQGFFARLLERKAVAKADRERGRFRSFLLADSGRDSLFLRLKETLSGRRSEIPYLELGRQRLFHDPRAVSGSVPSGGPPPANSDSVVDCAGSAICRASGVFPRR